jgi:hypothetical protein
VCQFAAAVAYNPVCDDLPLLKSRSQHDPITGYNTKTPSTELHMAGYTQKSQVLLLPLPCKRARYTCCNGGTNYGKQTIDTITIMPRLDCQQYSPRSSSRWTLHCQCTSGTGTLRWTAAGNQTHTDQTQHSLKKTAHSASAWYKTVHTRVHLHATEQGQCVQAATQHTALLSASARVMCTSNHVIRSTDEAAAASLGVHLPAAATAPGCTRISPPRV